MENNSIFFHFGTTLAIILTVLGGSVATREYGACAPSPKINRKCESNTFECLNGACIRKSRYCNGARDCSDGSDENYCNIGSYGYGQSCPSSPRKFIKCSNSNKCIPIEWLCDGTSDCGGTGPDERDCRNNMFGNRSIDSARQDAIAWFRKKTVPGSATRKWGPFVQKLAVAFYLSDPEFLSNSSTREQITYELSIQLLSRITQKKKIQGISSSDLASFVNAFLITCTDPTEFHGHNLVQELRSRVDKQNYTNPYVLLTLCNAGDTITDDDVKKLIDAFWTQNREIWTDTQAVALMALSCARNQTDSTVDEETIKELALELKQRQYRNGTVENLHNTLLVMQALYAAEPDEDPDNFDEKKAITYILQNQKPGGSFGNFLLTYYAMPVLSCKSLVNISSSHCKIVPKDEDTAVFDLVNRSGSRMRVQYSIWYGMERDIERTLTLKVPANTSFYGVMEIASEIDSKYRFEYVVRNRKPYITEISGTQDDPESEQFWFPYIIKDEKPSLLQKSTADVMPKNSDHIVMWYRKGSWVE